MIVITPHAARPVMTDLLAMDIMATHADCLWLLCGCKRQARRHLHRRGYATTPDTSCSRKAA